MNLFNKLFLIILENEKNDHTDNYCTGRYGPEKNTKRFNLFNKLRFLNSHGYYHTEQCKQISLLIWDMYKIHWENIEQTYLLLKEEKSKNLYLLLLAFRVLGHRKIKLPFTPLNQQTKKLIESSISQNDSLPSNWGKKHLYLHDFQYLGQRIRVYLTRGGSGSAFFLKQYHFKSTKRNVTISPEEGDTVIDCGVCWGDTTFEFACSVGKKGKVYAFEFIPFNLEVIQKNKEINPEISERILVIDKAVWGQSGKKVFFTDDGPGSRVQFEPFDGAHGDCTTLSIDDMVTAKKIEKVDFIKMDIEGAEPHALFGATQTIKKFKPKLAISIYHNLSDFCSIAPWINDLDLGYKFYLKHCTIHSEETVLFAHCI